MPTPDDAAAAFEAAFHAHVRAVRAYALRRTAPEDAADVVAETFAVRGTVPARHQPRSGALAVVLLLVLTGCGGGDAFPARFASEGEDTDHYTGQSVDVAPLRGRLSASIAVSSLYGSSADGHAGRYRFARLSFRLNGVPADTVLQIGAPTADERSHGADGSYDDQSSWDYQYSATFPAAAAAPGRRAVLSVDGCTRDGRCDRLELPLCPQGPRAWAYRDFGDNPCGRSRRVPLTR